MGFKTNSALRLAGGAVFDRDGRPKTHIARGIERAVEVQRPLVLANIRRLQRRHPDASAAELVKILEHHYLAAVAGGGAAVGGTALDPAVGPPPKRRLSMPSPSPNCTACGCRIPTVPVPSSWRSCWAKRAQP